MSEFISDPKSGLTFVVDETVGNTNPPSAQVPAASPSPAAEAVVVVEPVVAAVPEQQVAQVAATAQPAVAKAAAADSEELTAEEQAEFEGLMEGIVKARIGAAIVEARSGWQSDSDKRYSDLKEQLDKVQADARAKAEEVELAELDPEERAALLEKRGLDSRKAELDEYAGTLDEFYKDMFVATLIEDYGEYGITRERLQVFAEPEQMEAYCEQIQEAVGRALEAAGIPPGTPVSATQARPAATVIPEPVVPAGVTAASDVGADGAPMVAVKLEGGSGLSVMAKNIEKLGWETVRV